MLQSFVIYCRYDGYSYCLINS